MDSLALLCNLHGDGPETLRRLRRAGVSDLRSLFALGIEGVEPLLGRDRPAASRFLREARLLEQRQLLGDAEEPQAGAGALGSPVQRSAGPRPESDPHGAAGATGTLAAPHAPGGASPREPWPSSEAAAFEDSPAEEALSDYVLSPHGGAAATGPADPAEPRHSVLSALLAAWSRGNGALEGSAAGAGPVSSEPDPEEPRRGAREGAWPAAPVENPAAGNSNGFHSRGEAPGNPGDRILPGPIQLAQFLQPSAVEPGLERSAEALRRNRAAALPGDTAPGIALERGSMQAGGTAPADSAAQPFPPSAGPRPEPKPPGGGPQENPAEGTPLSRLAIEQVDPAAIEALWQAGLRTLEELLAAAPRDLAQSAGLPYTLVLRLQFLGRRCLRTPAS